MCALVVLGIETLGRSLGELDIWMVVRGDWMDGVFDGMSKGQDLGTWM